MQKKELNQIQLEQISFLAQTLIKHNWEEIKNHNNMFELDFCSMTPEAFGRLYTDNAVLELGYYAQDEYLSKIANKFIQGKYLHLAILSRDLQNAIFLRLYYGMNFKDLVNAIVNIQNELNLDNFAEEFIITVKGICERILIEVGDLDSEDGHLLEIK